MKAMYEKVECKCPWCNREIFSTGFHSVKDNPARCMTIGCAGASVWLPKEEWLQFIELATRGR